MRRVARAGPGAFVTLEQPSVDLCAEAAGSVSVVAPRRDERPGGSWSFATDIDRDLALAAPLLVVLGTDGDHGEDWLAAGEALQHMLLLAAGHGLHAGYLNQPCQVAELRPRLGELCESVGHPQVLLRIGRPAEPLEGSSRRPVDDVTEAGG